VLYGTSGRIQLLHQEAIEYKPKDTTMPDPREIATIVIDGQQIEDWETVWVHLESPSRWRSFRFSVRSIRHFKSSPA
jgi:hypothetical protein